MNERIKELELQAYVEVKQPWRDPSSGYVQEITTKEFSREKFAELIIKECLGDLKERIALRYQGSVTARDIGYGMEIVYWDIVDKFGVE
jgi:hypothetical protein